MKVRLYRDFPVHAQAIPLGAGTAERATLSLANGTDIETIAMAQGESVYFNWTAPETIEPSTKFYISFYWSPGTGASVSDTLRFGSSVLTIGDGEDLDASFPANATVDEAVLTANREYQHISGSITVSSTVAKGDTVLFKLTRESAGTMTEDAYLHKVRIQYLESATEPSII